MIRIDVHTLALVGPGLENWAVSSAVLRGEVGAQTAPSVLPPVSRLPATERRRVGLSVKVALALAEQLFDSESATPAADTATLFTSSGGDGENCHILCEALEADSPMLSPTRFTNSVHNAPAGYWSIAAQCRRPSTSLCAYDGSFAAGLIEAAIYAQCEREPIALIAYDVPYPEPLNSKRFIMAAGGVAMLLAPAGLLPDPQATLSLGAFETHEADRLEDPHLEAVRIGIPALRALPLLVAIACRESRLVRLGGNDGQVLPVEIRTPKV